MHGVAVSMDSTGPEQCAIFGRGYTSEGRQAKRYDKHEKYTAYHPAQLAHKNIEDYHRWISNLQEAA